MFFVTHSTHRWLSRDKRLNSILHVVRLQEGGETLDFVSHVRHVFLSPFPRSPMQRLKDDAFGGASGASGTPSEACLEVMFDDFCQMMIHLMMFRIDFIMFADIVMFIDP
jgi:hypothetical protein